MTEVEWAVSKKGDVLLAIPGSLGDAPASSYLSAFGKLHVRTEAGLEHVFVPNRSVALAIRRRSDILISEVSPSAETARTTRISTRSVPDLPGHAP